MGTITINVKDEVEKEFRETVKKEIGVGKGKLGSAVEEALEKWVYEREQLDISSRQLIILKMKKGLYKLPKGWKFNRDEAYDRK